jgi:hypothetical protein
MAEAKMPHRDHAHRGWRRWGRYDKPQAMGTAHLFLPQGKSANNRFRTPFFPAAMLRDDTTLHTLQSAWPAKTVAAAFVRRLSVILCKQQLFEPQDQRNRNANFYLSAVDRA